MKKEGVAAGPSDLCTTAPSKVASLILVSEGIAWPSGAVEIRVLKQVGDVTLSLALMGWRGLSQCTCPLNLFNYNLSRKRITLDKGLRAEREQRHRDKWTGQVTGFSTQPLPPRPQFPPG